MSLAAVYVNQMGETASLTEPGLIKLYENGQNGWGIKKELPFDINQSMGIAEYRRNLISMVQGLKDCRIFVAREVSGQLYYVLEANGFNSYEAEGYPEQYLDSVIETEEKELEKLQDKSRQGDSRPASSPQATKQPGLYFMDLRRALNAYPELSSKKILIPFLQKREFDALEIICDHIPNWFEKDLPALRMSFMIIKQSENEYHLKIEKLQSDGR